MPPGSNNPFGMKSPLDRNGHPLDPAVVSYTWEWENGSYIRKPQWFRKFDSIAAAFDAHGKLLATLPAYRLAMDVVGDPVEFAHRLTGVYATDPRYGGILISLMHDYELEQYDV